MKRKKNIIAKATAAVAMITGMFMPGKTKADPPYGCHGGTTYACGYDDVMDIHEDFKMNCCAGSELKVEDVCYGPTYHFFLGINGPNCGC